ncbi:MAG: GTPase HflX [Hyphomicrobiaceae bacterium]|nr:GTPase HflX [Hyphomicrobiaceae bacterium]
MTEPGRRQPAEPQNATEHQTRSVVLLPDIPLRPSAAVPRPRDALQPEPRRLADRLAEAVGLAQAIDLDVRDAMIIPLQALRPATLFGSGKVDEIATLVAEHDIDLVIIDHAVTPIQQRNLEKAWNTKVLDRTGLILEIFGRRARTREGRLQVELAHLTFQRSRLVRSWTHLERQRGGFGFLGGPGETQIETDRRLLQERIEKIRGELERVTKTRELHRRGRRRVPYPTVAIVGYTNAGKSTLFNTLTGAGVLAQDQVFATLDPTMREILLPSGRSAILSDTVGFISDLPTMLVAAFRATLEEVLEADLILHVRDIAHDESEAQRRDVIEVLASLGIDAERNDANLLEVWNKIDLIGAERRDELDEIARRTARPPVLVSAVTGVGLDGLRTAIDDWIGRSDAEIELLVPPAAGQFMHWLYENAFVLDTVANEDGSQLFHVRIDGAKLGKLQSQLKRAGLTIPVPGNRDPGTA